MSIGNRLKQVRKALNLTQKQFAEKLGIVHQYLSRYETDQADIPDKIKIKLHEMKINVIWLLVNEGDMFRTNKSENLSFDDATQLLNSFKLLSSTDRNEVLDLIKKLQPDSKK